MTPPAPAVDTRAEEDTVSELRVVILGRTQRVLDDVVAALSRPGVRISGSTDPQHLRDALSAGRVDLVVIGGGIDLDARMALVREVFERSADTTVHLNSPSGPASFLPFVKIVVDAFAP